MSDTRPSLGSAKEVDALAADWLQRSRFWDWSAADEAALQAWLAESFAHRAAYLRLADVWRRTERLVILRPPAATRRFFQFRAIHGHLAAGLAALGLLLLTAFNWGAPEPAQQTYATSVGGRETIVLVDGSQIELNTDTSVRVAKTGRDRMVWLDKGEAYFQIRHDGARPFVVLANGHRITDLGTKFVVRREPTSLEISLVEGRASVERPDHRTAVLSPGDVAVATGNSLSITRKPEQALTDDLGWRRGVLTFNHTTLAEAVAEFNRYNHTQLAVLDAAIGKRKIYGTFPTTDVEAFTRVVQAVFGLKVFKRGDEMIISQ